MSGTMAHVWYFADDRLEGRAVGTEGAHCAANYIAAQFDAIGLDPAAEEDNYLHAFNIRKGAEVGPDNRLTVDEAP